MAGVHLAEMALENGCTLTREFVLSEITLGRRQNENVVCD